MLSYSFTESESQLAQMEALPNKSADDMYTIGRLRDAISGSTEAKRTRGTLMSYLATMNAATDPGESNHVGS